MGEKLNAYVAVQAIQGGCALSGELCMRGIKDVLKHCQGVIDKATSSGMVLFDLGEITESDSSGLALLVTLMRYANRQGKLVLFRSVTRKMKDIARVSGLDVVLPLGNATDSSTELR